MKPKNIKTCPHHGQNKIFLHLWCEYYPATPECCLVDAISDDLNNSTPTPLAKKIKELYSQYSKEFGQNASYKDYAAVLYSEGPNSEVGKEFILAFNKHKASQ